MKQGSASFYKLGVIAAMAWIGLCIATPLHADSITLKGIISQSTQDGTGPAVNSPGLNLIQDGSAYTINLDFASSISSPGTFNLSGLKLVFGVDGAIEDEFNVATVTVAQAGALDNFSLLACLTSGSGCDQGNQLDLSFSIPFAALNGEGVTAQAIPGLLPLDLLEDDGVTDIHGTVASYSYSPPSSVPEPSSFVLLVSGAAAFAFRTIKHIS